MFFKILMYYILGYATISVEGYFIERFINICISKGIFLWNLKRKKSSFLFTNIAIKDFKKIRKIAKTTKCHVKIKKKKGLPFLLNRYKKRKIFIGLLIVIMLVIFLLSNFVWNIEIIGNINITKEELLNNLNEYGLKTGMLKAKVNTKDVINNIRLNRDDIAWVGIKMLGTNAIVEVVEADKKPEIINEEEYCNIISDKEGIITKINVQNGTALVKIGDIVKKGNVLVGGWLEGKFTGTRYVHAKAEIQAKVWYSKKEKMRLTTQIPKETGNEKTNYEIKLNNFKINFPKGVPYFENYDTISENKKLKIFSNFYFPIEITKTTYKELENTSITYTEEQAKEILLTKIEEELRNEIPNEESIVNTQVNSKVENETIEVEVIYEVLENIGTNEKILF